MSLYALFPPIETAPRFNSSTTNDGSSSSSSSQSVDRPLHLHDQKQHDDQSSGSFGTLLRASVDRFVPNRIYNSLDSSKDDDCPMGIEVKEAKIDPVRLVQSIVGGTSSRQSQQKNKKSLRRRSSGERESSQLNRSPPSSPNGRRNEKPCQPGANAHEDAIEFELSISFNGRKYEATRTLQCIIQLRNDLIREMKNKRRWLQSERMRQPEASNPPVAQSSKSSESELEDSTAYFEIPEIPPIGEGGGPGGFVGRGFTMLQAVLGSYCPTMERWLRNVLAIVPKDSECLTNFLWEPTTKENINVDLANSCVSLTTLGSIKELEGDECSTEDEYSDDEWEG